MVLTWIYLPNGHVIFCAMVQESVVVLLDDVKALNDPVAHSSHSGWAVVVPAVFVNLPGGHLVWAVQTPVVVVLMGGKALKNPVEHVSHSGCVV